MLARISHEELDHLMRGYGYTPHFVEGYDQGMMHELMAATLDRVFDEIRRIKEDARKNGFSQRPLWPMIALRTPKGWTCPKEIDGVMACCGDVPTLERLAAVELLRQHAPELKICVINVVDLMKLQPMAEHPHGLTHATSTGCSRRTNRSSLRFTAIHG